MIYKPTDKSFKNPIGAVQEGTDITIKINGNFDNVILICIEDKTLFERKFFPIKEDNKFVFNIDLPVGLYWYKFDLCNGLFVGADNNSEGIITDKPNSFQLSVYSSDFSVPNWLAGGIIYQIFPDRFFSLSENKNIEKNKILHKNKSDLPIFLPNENGEILNNDFFGGDIKGIINKLPYLARLGVSAIYLNPIFKAYSNHRYDTGDYYKIDNLLGDEEDFDLLISESDKLGIKIILDGVFNHTGDDSVYFNKYNNYNSIGAYNSEQSPYYNWFTFDNYPNNYSSWWGIKTLPTTNKNNSDFINFITGENGVLSYWTKKGVGGWRLDVVDELPSHFVKEIRKSIKKIDKNAIIIGEVWEDASNKISYGVRREYFLGKELDSVMNYPVKNAIIDFVKNKNCKNLARIILEQIDRYPSKVLHNLMNMLSTHDTFRILSALSDEQVYGKTQQEMSEIKLSGKDLENAIFRLKCATLLQYTLCGVPSIYYGDEAGVEGFKDPLNRKYFPWENINKEIQDWYIKLGEIRTSYSAFAYGDYCEIYAKEGLFVYKRQAEDSELLIVVNLGDKEANLRYDGTLIDLLNNDKYKDYITVKSNFLGIFICD